MNTTELATYLHTTYIARSQRVKQPVYKVNVPTIQPALVP